MSSDTDAPAGLRFVPGFVSEGEERALVAGVASLEFRDVVMHGTPARRTTAHFGWTYGYESYRLLPAPPLPGFLAPLRARAAALVDLAPEAFAEVLVTRYPPGAGIGWHRDAPMFGPTVVGVSLASEVEMRFRPGSKGRTAYRLALPARSAYVLAGAARTAWQHSIPAARALRYSITFRTLRRVPR